MASRCISTLNDLDKISDRIYYKHSKGRFRASIEAKLKVAREKAERSLRDTDKESSYSYKTSPSYRSSVRTSSATPSSQCVSTSASTASRSTASEHQKKAGKEKIFKPSTTKSITNGQRDKTQRRKTKSCPSCTLSNNTEVTSESGKTDISHTASVFGKFNGKESEYKPMAWFNLPQATSVGVIDSFACDAKNVEPLCYSVNVKKGESVPNLLRHNLEVRVGQNGVVRTEKKMEMMSELGEENAKQGKKRTAPLNWEEQLNWQNACVVSSGLQTNEDSSSKGLCETHPVIFHDRKSEQGKDPKRNEEENHSPAYKFSLGTRWVYPDRRNLVSTGDKCITVVEVEDTRSEEDVVVGTDSKRRSQRGANVTSKERTQNIEEKVSKKVSFEDEEATSVKTVGIAEEKHREKKVEEKFENSTPVCIKTDEAKKVGFNNHVRKIRPKTSQERSRTDEDDMTTDVKKLRRPHTAPPAPPSTPRLQAESRFSNCVPIKIPTSEGLDGDLLEDNNDVNTQNEKSEEKQTLVELSVSVTPEEADGNLIENEEFPAFSVEISACSTPVDVIQDGSPRKRVSFASCPRSAPVTRTTTPLKDGTIPLRAKSSTALPRKPYRSPSPVVIVSESSLELPKNLPPAQALVALRKKIREDLAQQNRDLQLDIQQLYLRKHSE
ncbi:hypothetical protein ACROYT_G043599 [Oculina patagonica]